MGHLVDKVWTDGGSGQSRRDRQPCRYQIYVPDLLVGRQFFMDGAVAADVSDAERAIVEFNAHASALVSTEALARILLRAESLASSRIEGLIIGARRILKAEVEKNVPGAYPEILASEVLANIRAMDFAISSITPDSEITLEQLQEINRDLLATTHLSGHGGTLRDRQNWIGGNDYNPCSADFVPPNSELVPDLMGDLVAFCNQDDLPAVAQAAIAHAQFETIHPFVDGNGRTGRVLVQMILRRRGLSPKVVPPVSLILATRAKDYLEGLTATRYIGVPSSQSALDGVNLWVGRFAAACSRAVLDAMKFEATASGIELQWRKRLTPVRRGSSLDALLQGLVGMPVLTVTTAMNLTGRSHQQTSAAIATLVEAGILRRMSKNLRNQTFEAPEIIAAFGALERELATPGADTRSSEPTRAVPARPQHR
ncbi:MAG: Fic family protein [Actinobacteria bacterium]|nr:Fic family protein [Actinomycetota bacterium]